MRDSVPSARYSSVCNVLRQWRIWLIPTEERRRIRKKKNAKPLFFTSRGAYVNLRYIAMLYTYSIGNQP